MTAIAIARFEDEGPFLRARTRANAEGRRILGEWMPYAPVSLGGGEGEGGILRAVILAGVAGFVGLFGLTAWSAVVAYPFDSGHRPPFSWQAFIPAPTEFAALIAAIGGLVMLFRNARLTRLHAAAFDLEEVAHASQGSFVLALGCDRGDDANAAVAMLAAAGAMHSRVVTA